MSDSKLIKAGLMFRWLNTAGFELILSSGKHLLVDPWLDEAMNYPIPLEQIERADYIVLSHIHFDHAQSVGRILNIFPHAKLFVGDLSADPLCEWQNINADAVHRMRDHEKFRFDDVTIEAVAGRHTQAKNGNYRNSKAMRNEDGSLNLNLWYGTLEMMNYRITTSDGMTVMVWGGMTTEEQIYRMEEYHNNDIAFMQVSPKQDFEMYSKLVQALNPKVLIPHHYDIWDELFKQHPEMLASIPLPKELINEQYVLGIIKDNVEKQCPNTTFLILEHHKWYRLGLSCVKQQE